MNWNGDKLTALCDGRGISPSELAGRMNVSRPVVYRWFSGSDPRGGQLLELCGILETDPTELYDIEPAQEPPFVGIGGKLFKRAGLRLVYALLTDSRLSEGGDNNLLNVPVRELAQATGLSTGSVSELLSGMKERGFLLTDERLKRLVNRKVLFDQWLHGYMETRFKAKRKCFETESIQWWRYRKPEEDGFLWGGEPAGAVLTDDFLRPQKLTLYTDEPLYDLVVDGNLHQVSAGGNVEFVEPFLKTEGERGCVHPLLVYADLICSSDDRNMETATRIYDRYLRPLIKSN